MTQPLSFSFAYTASSTGLLLLPLLAFELKTADFPKCHKQTATSGTKIKLGHLGVTSLNGT